MRIVDPEGIELTDPDLAKGYLKEMQILKENPPELTDEHPCYTDDDFEPGYVYFEGVDPEEWMKSQEPEMTYAELIQAQKDSDQAICELYEALVG